MSFQAPPTSPYTAYQVNPNNNDFVSNAAALEAVANHETRNTSHSESYSQLTAHEVAFLRQFLQQQQQHQQQQQLQLQQQPSSQQEVLEDDYPPSSRGWCGDENEDFHTQNAHATTLPHNKSSDMSEASQYNEFSETTHAWAIFASSHGSKATKLDRLVGCFIIFFQIFTYSLFAREAIDDYQTGQVPVTTGHATCEQNDYRPQDNDFYCEADYTNNWDALVAFIMLGIFLSADFIQAGRAVRYAPTREGLAFAVLAAMEVTCAFVAACIAVSYNLYIGEVTDAVEVGVGLLFIRELSARAYHGIRQKQNALSRQHNPKRKQYKIFFGVLLVLVVIGLLMDPLCEYLFAVNGRF